MLLNNALYSQSQAKEGVLGSKDEDGRERRHTGGNNSGTQPQQTGQSSGAGAQAGNKLLRQNSQNSQTKQKALSKSNKGCGKDQASSTQGMLLLT